MTAGASPRSPSVGRTCCWHGARSSAGNSYAAAAGGQAPSGDSSGRVIVIGNIGRYTGPESVTIALATTVLTDWVKDVDAACGINTHQMQFDHHERRHQPRHPGSRTSGPGKLFSRREGTKHGGDVRHRLPGFGSSW